MICIDTHQCVTARRTKRSGPVLILIKQLLPVHVPRLCADRILRGWQHITASAPNAIPSASFAGVSVTSLRMLQRFRFMSMHKPALSSSSRCVGRCIQRRIALCASENT